MDTPSNSLYLARVARWLGRWCPAALLSIDTDGPLQRRRPVENPQVVATSARETDLPDKSRTELFMLEDHVLGRKLASREIAELWKDNGLLAFHQRYTKSDGTIAIPARYTLTDRGRARLHELQRQYWCAELAFSSSYHVLSNESTVPPGGCSVIAWSIDPAPSHFGPYVAKPLRKRKDMYLPPEVAICATPDGHLVISSDSRSIYVVTLKPQNNGLLCTACFDNGGLSVPWGHGQAGLALSLKMAL